MSYQLFSSAKLGNIELANHIVMAPMTRSRAIGNIPTKSVVTYYAQRASAGLIITEGTSPSPNGLGYARIPGIFSAEQIAGWKEVTSAVHEKGGKIFIQLMHCGRIAHPANMPEGATIVAPSAVAAAGQMWTDTEGMQPQPTPLALTIDGIKLTILEYVQAAKNAIEAGFDGVELHGANGYLIDQFINTKSNLRTDEYGGDIAGRAKFLLEIAAQTVEAIGKEKVGVRLSPYGAFNDVAIFDTIDTDYQYIAEKLNEVGVVYTHLVDHSSMGAPAVSKTVVDNIRKAFKGTLILSGGYDVARAEADLESGIADLIAIGRPFIANPDLVERLKQGAELATPNPDLFYSAGDEGFIDYSAL
ncbi:MULTISPECIES: alkene reductase [unclassified Arcicella]|uniref:alkene reductase n=1 Tax=unclassified Arcicella TaxID=2644986 RepID=UPI00285BBE7E|nr:MULTISPECIES: alkene reductase [unclassified Arcicella]MDR6564615.1 N-ethylmaleimide reductase [Arcicella sp. BE51]MDR6814457.1 N-ethylmaleimide reductase [Arcicella sp. BE140]MDR6825787.1 N-ethylmaleimide reductase [Arcicella sp. BE139]